MKKVLTVVLSMLLALTSLVPVSRVAHAQDKDTFTYAISGDPFTTNPIIAQDRWGLTFTNMVFSPLMRLNSDGTTKYELAESMEVAEDGLSINVKLKDGLKWSDGEPVKADDVVFTYGIKSDKKNGAVAALTVGDDVIKVEKVDDLNVKFILPAVSAAALNKITFETYIIPEHIYKDVKDFSENTLEVQPVGSGPYKLVEYKNGEYLKFEANENYYGGKANIKNIVFRIIPEADAVKVALQTGEVDASMVGVSAVEELKAAGLDVYTYSEDGIGYVGFNLSSDAFQSKEVRQAVMYAINREEMNTAMFQKPEFYQNVYSVLPTNNPFYNSDIEPYNFDQAKAKELIEKAGVKDVKLNIAYDPTNKAAEMMATLMKERLAEVGIELELIGAEQSTIINEQLDPESKKYNMFINGYVFGVEPDSYSAMFGSEGAFNIFHIKNETLDKLFEDGQKELDETKRKEIYAELQKVIADEAFIYPHATALKIIVSNPRIKGFEEAKFVPIYSLEDMSKLKIEQ